ncbi:autotransporter outer membrane beta-barrel domain-containing protein (plasmid) [Ensifer sp. PDNC004]|nr:autotransporter outer membrane beta-barrel domain-containing protein [Ensifer sp. PDNC004]
MVTAAVPVVVLLATALQARAQVILSGDTDPSDPAAVDSSMDLVIGNSAVGSLTISNGGILTNYTGIIGNDLTGVGTVSVLGQGTHWDNFGDVVTGQSGRGTLDILGGGLVTSEAGYIGAGTDSVGVVTISGNDGFGVASSWTLSQDLRVGDEGSGTLNVTDGGRVVTTRRINIGNWNAGTVTASNGAELTSHDGIVGVSARGEALLSSGATWSMMDQLTVGLFAQGTLRVEDGASITSNQGYVGANSGGDGSVTVTGAGSSWVMTGSNLTLGNYGVGTMTIEDGARVYAKSGVYVGISDAAASGTLNVLGTSGARGVLETSGLRGGLGTASVTVDGGIVRAIGTNENFFRNYGAQKVTLGTGGGIFDTNGHDIGIAPEITGAGGLTKQGGGTLTLTGANSFAGGTTINAGTLQLGNGGTNGSIIGDVANDGTLSFNRSDLVNFDGTIAGSGGVHQVGTGQTTLTQDSSGLSGMSRITNGILSVDGILGGTLDVTGGRLQGDGRVGTTTNFAGGTIAPGNSIGTLTVAGNYAGSGGTLEIETVLGDDLSKTDRLVVTGNTSGNTSVRVINVGGAGAQTNEGIKIIDIGGASGGSFSLLGDYVFQGDQAVVAGAYAYRLYQGGMSTPADGDWYLRSALLNSGTPTEPLYQAGAPIYEAYASVLQSFNDLETLQQRVGNRSWTTGTNQFALTDPADNSGFIWSRIAGRTAKTAPEFSTTGMQFDTDTWQIQSGVEGQLSASEAGSLIASLYARYGNVTGQVSSIFGNGSIRTDGYGLGGALTWYGTDGFYIDSQASLTWYDSTLKSSTAAIGLTAGNGGFGYALGVEAGQKIALNANWGVTPQAQIVYSGINYSQFTDAFGTNVALKEGDDFKIRLGISADYENAWRAENGETSRLHAYAIADLYNDFLPQNSVEVDGVRLAAEQDNLWAGIGLGGTYSWGDGKYALHGQGKINTGLGHFGTNYALTGTVGLTARF